MSDKKARIPQIRFAGFEGEWEERKLGDVLDEMKSGLSRMLSNDDIGLPVVRANNVNEGSLNMVDDVKYWYVDDPQGANTSNYLVHKNDILVNFINSEAKMGTATIVDIEPHRDTIYTTNIMKLKVNSRNDPYFVFNQTFCQKYKNYVKSITKPAVNQASFTTVDFKKFEFFAPNNEEQARVGAFLTNLNNLITLQQRQLDQLASVKKTMLAKMFPKDGANVPEIRFAGFSGAWEERKLGEATSSYSGGTPTVGRKEYYSGKIPFIRSAEINSDTTELFLSECGLMNSSAKMVNVGDILYALYGATSGEVGISKIQGAINQAILGIKPDDGYDSQFLMQWLRGQKQKIIDKYLQGGQGNLSGSIVKDLMVKFPNFAEQQKIGVYFSNFDTLLTLHQRQLNALKTLKKSLLQQLFV